MLPPEDGEIGTVAGGGPAEVETTVDPGVVEALAGSDPARVESVEVTAEPLDEMSDAAGVEGRVTDPEAGEDITLEPVSGADELLEPVMGTDELLESVAASGVLVQAAIAAAATTAATERADIFPIRETTRQLPSSQAEAALPPMLEQPATQYGVTSGARQDLTDAVSVLPIGERRSRTMDPKCDVNHTLADWRTHLPTVNRSLQSVTQRHPRGHLHAPNDPEGDDPALH